MRCSPGTAAENTGYVIGSRKTDLRGFVKEFNAAFSGRGGGRPEMVQGTAKGGESEIREWILEESGEDVDEADSEEKSFLEPGGPAARLLRGSSLQYRQWSRR